MVDQMDTGRLLMAIGKWLMAIGIAPWLMEMADGDRNGIERCGKRHAKWRWNAKRRQVHKPKLLKWECPAIAG